MIYCTLLKSNTGQEATGSRLTILREAALECSFKISGRNTNKLCHTYDVLIDENANKLQPLVRKDQ